MAFEDVMKAIMTWGTSVQALSALGAELALAETGATAPPDIAAALKNVSTAAGIDGIDELPPPQRQIALGFVRLYFAEAHSLLAEPAREPGWSYTEPEILEGLGRGSSMIPAVIAGAHPDLANVTSFLDVGTGVGFLAIAAANVWPSASVVGIDPWEPSLERARANVGQAGLGDRIKLQQETLADVDAADAFDVIWIPTFFLTDDTLAASLPAAFRALRAGGWIVLGRDSGSPDPLGEATENLRWVRGGGASLDGKRATALLEAAGCVDVHVPQTPPQFPLVFTLGQRPKN